MGRGLGWDHVASGEGVSDADVAGLAAGGVVDPVERDGGHLSVRNRLAQMHAHDLFFRRQLEKRDIRAILGGDSAQDQICFGGRGRERVGMRFLGGRRDGAMEDDRRRFLVTGEDAARQQDAIGFGDAMRGPGWPGP